MRVLLVFSFPKTLCRMIGYYERSLTDLACGRMDTELSQRYLLGGSLIKIEDIMRLNDDVLGEQPIRWKPIWSTCRWLCAHVP